VRKKGVKMSIIVRIVVESVDAISQEVLNRDIIRNKSVEAVKSIVDLGYKHQEQIDILQKVRDAVLYQESHYLQEELNCCLKCGGKMSRKGFFKSEFHAVFTDHKVGTRRLICTKCGFSSPPSIQSLLGTSMHPDLAKLECKISAQHSYRETEDILDKKSASMRQINNHDRIRKTVTVVGGVIDEQRQNFPQNFLCKTNTHAKKFVMRVDGGHVPDKNPDKQSFEVLTATIYNPKHVAINPKTEEVTILNKSCVASALSDEQKKIKSLAQQAAREQDISLKTGVTALCDGAQNCWNVVDSLASLCGPIERILDWFHIAMKFINIELSNDDQRLIAKKAKWHLWRGCAEKSIQRMVQLLYKLTVVSDKNKLKKLISYIQNNKDYIVNYKERMANNLVFTSQLAESTVESLINRRCKGQQHMRWTRPGIHSLLQVRATIASNHWIEYSQTYILTALTQRKNKQNVELSV
jgi:hypothetical protein